MKRIVIFLFFVFSLQTAFSQDFEVIRHQVKMGETIRMISRKYKVEPSEIYKLNKFAVDGISQGMVLQIMVPKKEASAENPQQANSTEQPKQTSEVTQTTTSETANPDETTNSTTTTVKKTTIIRKKKQVADSPPVETSSSETPAQTTSTSTESAETSAIHTVSKGETMFSIAKKYNVSVDELKSQNAVLQRKGLQPGQVLTIVSKSGQAVEKVPDNVVENTAAPQENAVPSDSPTGSEVKHTVQKGETLYSLAKKYNVSVEAIKMQNEQALKKGLQVGQVLVIGISK